MSAVATPRGAVSGLAHDDGRRAPVVLVTATPRGTVRTHLRRWKACTSIASRRHSWRSHLDSPATMGAVPVATTTCGAVQTSPRGWEAHSGSASRRRTSRSHSDSPAMMGGVCRQCQSPPHLAELFGLACNDGLWRCALRPAPLPLPSPSKRCLAESWRSRGANSPA